MLEQELWTVTIEGLLELFYLTFLTQIMKVSLFFFFYFLVKKGDRVAQLILERICMAPIIEVDSLDETERYSL